jgi:uncharacterized membrane protein YciS (DUF1049 family)
MSTPATGNRQIFIGPGLSSFKRNVTILGVTGVTALVVWIALHEGLPAIGSTVVAILFILGFVVYLRIVAPVPFTIALEEAALVKRSKNGEVIEVKWEDLTRVKEEFFPNGKRIGITAYRTPAAPGQKTKAWAVYRDDVADLDGLAEALKQRVPASCQWLSETVHE